MKYISRILFISALAFELSACSDSIRVYDPQDGSCAGDMTVNISAVVSGTTPATKSKVSGEETRIHTMQMVCFDANGQYLGIRNATVTPGNATTPDKGKIKGTVPQGTSRIHFIANRNLTIPLNAGVGTPEAEVMSSEELSTLYENADGTKPEVCYWGYHKEDNATAMDGWLNPTSTQGESKVYMIRDRARVVLTYDPAGATIPVTKIEWLIHNGRERGYLAPAEASWGNTAYYANSTVEGHTDELVSNAGMNEYTDCGRYSLWRSASDNDDDKFDVAYENGENTGTAQYLFDDTNEAIDGLKAILRVTYTVDGSDKTVYHVLKLNDNDQVLYDVVRHNTYYINAKLLSPHIGFYETLEKAINGEEFINADIEVDRSITDINNEEYTLQILLPTETTSIVFNTEDTYDLDFAFRLVSDVTETGSTSADDFEIKWEKDQTFCTAPSLSYVSATKQFQIHTKVIDGQLSDQLQSEWIVVRHKDSGLTRYIHVYVIDQFKYLEKPTLKSAGNGEYILNFTIPPTESDDPTAYTYPVGLYPIDVKFTTNTLNAYGTTQGATDEYGLFGVGVGPTLSGDHDLRESTNFETGYNSPVSSTNYNADRIHWYFQQADKPWDFWYTYSIKNYEQTNNGEVNIYFKDVRSHIEYANVQDVGLFMEIKYFGKIYSLPVTQ